MVNLSRMEIVPPPHLHIPDKGILWNASCERLLPCLGKNTADLILCDPPYGITQACWDQPLDWEVIWKSYREILKPDGLVALFGSKPLVFQLGTTAPKGWYRYDWVWEKSKATGHLNSKRRPMRAHEEILIFSPRKPRYYPQMRTGQPYDKGKTKAQREDDIYGKHHTVHVQSPDGSRYPRTVLYFKTAESERGQYPLLHNTQKPQSLLRYLIETYTLPGQTVLDHCFGSCATGIACLETGRKFIGIEQDLQQFETGSQWFTRVAANQKS